MHSPRFWLAILHVAGANQPKRSSSSFFVFVTAPPRCVFVHPLSSPPSSFGLHLHLALSLFLSCMYTCMYVCIYIYSPSKRRVWERGGGARIRVSFAAVPREAFGSRCRVCRKHRGSGHSLSRSGSRVQLCRRRGN